MKASYDEFMSYESPSKNFVPKEKRYIIDWKKEGKTVKVGKDSFKSIRVWLADFPQVIYQHQIRKLVSFKDKNTGEKITQLWRVNQACSENAECQKFQNRRNADGVRELAPCSCAICKLLDVLCYQLGTGEIRFTTPIFEYPGMGKDNATIIDRAGPITGKLTATTPPEILSELGKFRIYSKDGWLYTMKAKQAYIFSVIDNDRPEEGARMYLGAQTLGEKLRSSIKQATEGPLGANGNPFNNPYAFEWRYNKDAAQAVDTYEVMPKGNEQVPLTEEIAGLLQCEPPDTSSLFEPYRADELRATWERFAKVKLPWDDIFSSEPLRFGTNIIASKPTTRKMVAPPTPEPEPETDKIACDNCGFMMDPDLDTCPKCNAKYDVSSDDEEETTPEPVVVKPSKIAAKSIKPAITAEDENDIPF